MEDTAHRKELAGIFKAYRGYEALLRSITMRQRQALTKTQMDVLMIARFAGPIRMGALAEALGVSKEQATRAVNPLVEQGLAARSRGISDGKVVEITLTPEGESFIDSAYQQIERLLDESLAPLSPADRQALFASSAQAGEILRKLFRAH